MATNPNQVKASASRGVFVSATIAAIKDNGDGTSTVTIAYTDGNANPVTSETLTSPNDPASQALLAAGIKSKCTALAEGFSLTPLVAGQTIASGEL